MIDGMRASGEAAHSDDGGEKQQLTVMLSVAPLSDRDNPYIKLLCAALPADVAPRFYNKWAAILGRYDVFHMHWPDHLLRGGGPAKVWARRAVFAALLARLTVFRTPMVRTVHNVTPHEKSQSRTERALLAWMDRLTKAWIVMNAETPVPPGADVWLIPHGHYRDWYATDQPVERIGKRIIQFGLVRAYKNVPGLVRVVREMDDRDVQLHVLGECSDASLARAIHEAVGADPRIVAELSHATEAVLTREILESALVVLPYTQLLNSGALLLALSLDRPVLVPDTPATRTYAAEFGAAWVGIYEGELTPLDVSMALDRASLLSASDSPPLESREWSTLAATTARLYRRVANRDAGQRLVRTQIKNGRWDGTRQ